MAYKRRNERKDCSLAAELKTDSQSFTCTVVNLSNGGSKIEIAQFLEREQLVQLNMGNDKQIRGRIAWAETPYYGMEFDEEGNKLADTLKAIKAYKAEGPILN